MAKLGTFTIGQVLTAAELNAMGGAYTAYTPTWTGITIGNGTNSGGYVQFGRITYWRAGFAFGTTSSVTGAVTVTLPPFALRDANNVGVFSAKFLDNGVAWFDGQINASSTTVVTVGAFNTAGTYLTGASLSSTIPFGTAWATSDQIIIAGVYEAAS